jgi:undecaprenyl phosphate N,N'-diacetylbacillosamine 1-phosphate transferase
MRTISYQIYLNRNEVRIMKAYLFIKSFADKVFAIFLLLLLWPIMILCAIAIIIEDPSGFVLFKQKRVGKENKVFTLYKFRSMRVELVRHENKLSDSERMLKTGRFIRRTSLDELPQLFNIIKGEMSFIGPRPLPTIYLGYYNEKEIHRHDVKPGISGLAQVSGRNNINWEEKFSKDLEYVNKISLILDIKIFFLTLYKIVKRSDVIVRGENCVMDFHEYRIMQKNQLDSTKV